MAEKCLSSGSMQTPWEPGTAEAKGQTCSSTERETQPLGNRQPAMAVPQRVPPGTLTSLSRGTVQLMSPPPWIPVVTSPEVFAEGSP